MRGFIGGDLYTSNVGFKKLLPFSNENSEQTGHTLKIFIELVFMPTSLHSNNHNDLKEGLFNILLQKFEFNIPSKSHIPRGKTGHNPQ